MIVCRKCGFHNADSDDFCGSCGSFLEFTGEKVAVKVPEGFAAQAEQEAAVVADRRRAFETALAGTLPGGQLTILAGYTPMLELRALMHERGWVGRLREA